MCVFSVHIFVYRFDWSTEKWKNAKYTKYIFFHLQSISFAVATGNRYTVIYTTI